MTTILVTDIPNFREKSSLDLTVSEVATYIRGAQVYGSTQKGSTASAEPAVAVPYGIHLDQGSGQFYLFKDTYSSGSSEETYTLNNFKIDAILIRYGDITDTYSCNFSSFEVIYNANNYTGDVVSSVQDAKFKAWANGGKCPNGGTECNLAGYDYADILIKGIKNPSFVGCLRIYRNGQIAPVSCSQSDSFKVPNNNSCNAKLNTP